MLYDCISRVLVGLDHDDNRHRSWLQPDVGLEMGRSMTRGGAIASERSPRIRSTAYRIVLWSGVQGLNSDEPDRTREQSNETSTTCGNSNNKSTRSVQPQGPA